MSGWKAIEMPLVAALAFFAFVNAVCWANVIPAGRAPDEAGHFEVVAFEAIFLRIPEFGVDDYGAMARTAVDGYRTPYYAYSAQPGLAYMVSAAAVRLLRDEVEPYLAARYPGAMWAAWMTIVVFVAVRAMFPGAEGPPVLAAVLVTFWPQLTLVFSYTNNDGLTALASTALIGSWFTGRQSGWRPRDLVLTGLLAGVVMLNKPNGVVVVAATVALMIVDTARRRVPRLGSVIAVGAAILVSGWWYVVAWFRYGADVFASARAERLRQAVGAEWSSGRAFGLGFFETAYGAFPRYGEPWIVGTLRSTVGVLGEMTDHLPTLTYAIVGTLVVLGVAGFARQLASRQVSVTRTDHVLAIALMPALLGLSLHRSWAFDYQAQGRYLFPALLPVIAVVACGLVGHRHRLVRSAVGFVATIGMAAVAVDTFVVRVLRMYDITFGDLVDRHPILVIVWCGSLIGAIGLSILYWLRVYGAERPE